MVSRLPREHASSKCMRFSPTWALVTFALVASRAEARGSGQLGRPGHAALAEDDRSVVSSKGRTVVRKDPGAAILLAPAMSTYLAAYWESCVQQVGAYVSASPTLNGQLDRLSFRNATDHVELPKPIFLDAIFLLGLPGDAGLSKYPYWVWALLITWVAMGIRLPVAPREPGRCASSLSLPYRHAQPIGLLALQLYLLMELGQTWGTKGHRRVILSTLKGGTYLCEPSMVGEVLVSHFENDYDLNPPDGLNGLVKDPDRLAMLMPGLASGKTVRTWRFFLAVLRWLADLSGGAALIALRWDESKQARPSNLTQLFLLVFAATSLYFWGLHGALDERHRFRMFPWVAIGLLVACAFSWDDSTSRWLSQWVLMCVFIPPYLCSGVDKFLYSTFWAEPGAGGGRHVLPVLKDVLECWAVGRPLTKIVKYNGFPWAQHFLKDFPFVASIAGVGTLAMELALPVLSLFHDDLRGLFGVVVICFHLGVFCVTAIDFKEFMLLSLIFVLGVDWRSPPRSILAERATASSPSNAGQARDPRSLLHWPILAAKVVLVFVVVPHGFQRGPLNRSSGGETLLDVLATFATCATDPVFWLFAFAIARTNLGGRGDAVLEETAGKPKAEFSIGSPLARLESGLREAISAHCSESMSLVLMASAIRGLLVVVVLPVVVQLLFGELCFPMLNLIFLVAMVQIVGNWGADAAVAQETLSGRVRKLVVLVRDLLLILTPLCWLSVIFEARAASFPYSVFPMFGSYC